MVEEKITEKYLNEAREENGVYVLSHVCNIERTTEQRLTGDGLLEVLNQIKGKIESNDENIAKLSADNENLESEYDILEEVAINAGLIEPSEDEEEESDEDEDEDNSEEEGSEESSQQ